MREISKKAALNLGLRHYFTGQPCKNGHISRRLVSSGACMICDREKAAVKRRADPAKQNEIVRRSRAKDPDKDRERKRKWCRDHPEVMLERGRRYRQKHKEKIKQHRRDYFERNPEVGALTNAIRRARKKGAAEGLTQQDVSMIQEIYRKCAELNKREPRAYHVDHIIPLSKGGKHHPSNLQILPALQNLSKSAKIVSYEHDYRRDGFVIVRNAVQFPRSLQWKTLRENLMQRRARSMDDFRRYARIIPRLVEAHSLFLSPEIRKAVAAVAGIREPIFLTDPVGHAMGFDESFDGTRAHQDFCAMQSSLNAVVVWIPLHSVNEHSYPLELVRGSHLLGLQSAKQTAHYSEIETEFEFETIKLKAGDALLFSAFTVHRTLFPGRGQRFALSWRYEDSADPWFVDHGFPSAQSRVIEREVKIAPTAEEVRSVFA